MAVSFIRVDDRMIHGQTCTRWALEYPCDGLIAVNNAAAGNAVLKAAYKSQKVLDSKDNYFLITKNPLDMEVILVDQGFKPGVKDVIIGPCNDRPGTTKLGNNQSITPEEAQALENIMNAGYNVEFALLKEEAIGNWKKFRGQFGYN